MSTQLTYIPLNCWKCKAQNNAARNMVCRVCGSHLKLEEAVREDNYSDPVTAHPAFRGFIWSSLVVVVIAAGLIFFYGRGFVPVEKPAALKKGAKAEVTLPANSWYNKSWWSYISKYPSAQQVLQKNIEANGPMPPPEAARTISVAGKIAQAKGKCFMQACLDEAERRKKEYDRQLQEQARAATREDGIWRPTADTIPRLDSGKKAEPVMSDSHDKLNFDGFGEIEVLAKVPGKSVKKARATIPSGPYRTAEIYEVFNGEAGKKTVNYLDVAGKVLKSEVEIMDAEKIANARAELEPLWQKDFSRNSGFKVRGIERVNETVVFVLVSKNKQGDQETHYFDSVTGFLVKMDTKDLSIYLEDYKAHGQGQLPFRIYYRRAESGGFHSWLRFEVGAWKIGEQIDDSVFEIPGS